MKNMSEALTFQPATTIDEVIIQLDKIIQQCKDSKSRIGFFSALYYKVTVRVKEAIEREEFEDNPRMERFDVAFANRFIEAYHMWQANELDNGPWHVAFQAAESRRPIILQHMLLGMNAHINLDLGIAAVEVSDCDSLESMHHDFNRINDILGAMTFEVIQALNQVSPVLSLMGLHAGNETILIQFSIANARDGAWGFAEALYACKAGEETKIISERSRTIEKLAESLLNSSGLIKITLWFIRLLEWRNPRKIIDVLYTFENKFIHFNPGNSE